MKDDRHRAVITGIGILAANGLNREEFAEALIEGKSGLQDCDMFHDLGIRTGIAGQIKMDFPELEKVEDIEKTVLMAYRVIDEAFQDSGLCKEELSSLGRKAGISFSTSLGGYLRTLKHVKNKLNGCESSPDWLIEVPSCSTLVSKYAGVKGGPVYTTMSACAAGTGAAAIALDSIRSGKTELMVVVGADPLTEISASGFHSMKSMSINGCRPFDKDCDGMTIGEGAAAFIVESLDRALERDAYIYAEILGYGLGNDAYHITSPDPEGIGAFNTMVMAQKDAGIEKGDIDYINTHGTATRLNDLMEMEAISRFYQEEDYSKVFISSTKSMTGHCLGAAGSIELAVIVLAVDRGIIPTTVRLENTLDEYSDFNIVKGKSMKREVNKAISNSFAFAGHSASIIVGKY